MTGRQEFICNLRKGGFSLERIAKEYQKNYDTKRKPSREVIRRILASYGL